VIAPSRSVNRALRPAAVHADQAQRVAGIGVAVVREHGAGRERKLRLLSGRGLVGRSGGSVIAAGNVTRAADVPPWPSSIS
jgi:hypothetical protein